MAADERRYQFPESLGDYLKRQRSSRKMSVERMAGLLRYETSHVESVEVGSEVPSPHYLYTLSNVLSLDYVELMKRAGHIIRKAPT